MPVSHDPQDTSLPAGEHCPACHVNRLHTEAEFRRYHPLAGHGYNDGTWSSPAAEQAHMDDVARLERSKKTHEFEGALAGSPDRPCQLCGRAWRAGIHKVV